MNDPHQDLKELQGNPYGSDPLQTSSEEDESLMKQQESHNYKKEHQEERLLSDALHVHSRQRACMKHMQTLLRNYEKYSVH